ncbi:putative pfs domain protein [Diaporthe ampelina]|uniref:Putative pfs domain protein n=1 Tax=Diaporthe ampelina TaxID=1214573 RepID=A0A0G2HIM7_9PEZI|nr:putative pfs domain protein [Diaporthe ampelina]
MSTSGKQAQRTTKVPDGTLQAYRAEFTFEANLREYVRLQGLASGEKRTLSNIISFTSAGSNVDALALPTSKYVTDTWKQDGAKLLQMIERALDDSKNQEVSGLLTLNTHVSVAVHDNYLLLKIRGAKDNFPKIIEQVCWVASVAGGTSISLLKKFAKETNNGATTRGYAETVHTGKPVLTAGANGQFKVSFSPPRTEKDPNHGFVAKSGHCWKTMAGLSIVASGYTVPPRPEEGSGLEAPLVVLHELFRRGCARKRILPLDKPMVMIPTKVGTHADDEAYQLRMIMAVGAQQRTQGNAIYWHFDPAKLCNSMESCEQLEKEIRASPSIKVLESQLLFLAHYELVIPSASASLRIPPIFTLTAGIGREKVDILLPTENMSDSRSASRTILRFHHFVLWDTQDNRGWLVNGQTVALHLLRGHLKYRAETKDYSFSKLERIGDETPAAAERLLLELEKEKLPAPEGPKNNEEKSKDTASSKDQDDAKKFSIGEVLDGIYAVLLKMRDATESIMMPGNTTWTPSIIYMVRATISTKLTPVAFRSRD